MRVRIFFHDRCFDGASSAALFSRFYQERIREDVKFEYTGLVHRAGSLFDEVDRVCRPWQFPDLRANKSDLFAINSF